MNKPVRGILVRSRKEKRAFVFLKNNLSCSEWNVGRNIDGKDHFDEVSCGNEEYVTGN